MKAIIGFVIGVALAAAAAVEAQPAGQVAQIAAQVSQLASYVGKVGARLLVAEQRLEAERARNKALNVYILDFVCKHNRLAETIQNVSKATDAAPVQVQIVSGKNCAQDGPAPELPADTP